jgi:putative transposase
MKHQVIKQLKAKGAESIDHVCRVLEASRSGYYAARRRAEEPAKACLSSTLLRAAFAASGRSYGSRRLRAALTAQGHRIGRHRVRTLMHKHALKPVWKRKFTATTDSRHNLPVYDNVLDRRFDASQPNQAWVSDITYIRTRSGWLYLAAVLDLHSRKLVGWAMAPTMPADLVCTALQMAICQRAPAPGLMVHSDRGSQYASEEHRKLLDKHKLVGSMSRKGNCWDNAVMERFFLNLKMERVWQRDYANHQEAINDITDYIVNFYNSKRLHSALGYLPPNVYEQQLADKPPILVSEKT